MIVMMLEAYKPYIQEIVVSWKTPNNGCFKCYSDGVKRGNPGPSGGDNYFRDSVGDFFMPILLSVVL